MKAPDQQRGKSMAWQATIAVPQDLLDKRQQHYQVLSVDATLEKFSSGFKSVPTAALPYQLLITVSATGELEIRELSTSHQQLGLRLAMHRYLEDWLKSLSSEVPSEATSATYPTPLPEVEDWHRHAGMLSDNCRKCNMPLVSAQHNYGRYYAYTGLVDAGERKDPRP